jgi:LPXTG-motif cell wall-anchored protein
MTFRLSAVLGALFCAAALGATSAAADGQASFAVKPVAYDPSLPATKSYFILTAKPGQEIADRVRVVNTGTAAGTAYLYAVDATTGQTSGAVYLSRSKPRRDVGAWIRLAGERVTLAPGAQAIVPFTIRVPVGVRAGDHVGGIVAENSAIQHSTGHGALQIRIKHLTIAAVELQLPGRPFARVVATGVKAGGQNGWQYVYVHLVNPGTIMVKPQGRLVVANAAGRKVAARLLRLDTFLPRTAIDYPVLLPKQTLPPGSYTASVTIGSSNRTIVGYRKTVSAPFSATRSFPFTVSSGQQKQVFSGVAPVTAPAQAAPASHTGKSSTLGFLLVGSALILLLALALWIAIKRRSRKPGGTATGNEPQTMVPK